MRLLDLEGRIEVRVFETGPLAAADGMLSFHPKAYIFHSDGGGSAFVGSSNVSEAALTSAIEWNYRVVFAAEGNGFDEIRRAFERVFSHPATRPLTPEWIRDYRDRRPRRATTSEPVEVQPEPAQPPVQPNEVQQEALAALEETRSAGNKAGLVVLATGLGKTWLSAFDTNRPEFARVLFVAHREEILNQALDTFRRIRPNATLTRYTGQEKNPDGDVVFASVQTLGRVGHLRNFAPDTFDYVIVDEFHHAAAATYQKLIAWFEPKFLLGLTATPERTDGGDLLALCQQNLVFRCDLVEGVRKELLSPFHYFSVPDEVDYTNIPWRSTRFDEEALTEAVATHRRAENALEQFRKHGAKRALGFPFSTAIWNAGFVKRPGHIFLLTTLDKAGHGSDFQYQDHFISRTEFQWQSQNRTSQESSDGQDIKHHAERQIGVHLFVRQQKRRVGGPGAAPFVYCGDVSFVDWSGERPITVRWRLPIEVPDQVWSTLVT